MTDQRPMLDEAPRGPGIAIFDDNASPGLEPATTRADWWRALRLTGLAAVGLALLLTLVSMPAIGGAVMASRTGAAYVESLPTTLPSTPTPQRSRILAADGSLIGEFYSENRRPVQIERVAPIMQRAIVAIEDSRFYSHDGFDARGTLRAAASNLASDSTQGGSTITQQYVKNVLLNAATSEEERTEATSQTSYARKLREARIAVALEKRLPKKRILERYLNISYFGDGAYGIDTAARHFFSTRPADLTLPQAALLAGLVKSPTAYDPTKDKAAALTRRNVVLLRMRQLGDIGPRAYAAAVKAPLGLSLSDPRNGCVGREFAFYCAWVKQQLERDPVFGATPEARQQRLYRGGMTIRTPMQPRAQRIAQRAVDDALGRDNRVAAASVTVQPGTGEVVAMATNRTFGSRPGQTEVILPATPAYQPGSNFKPFTLATALERGYDLSTVTYAPPVYAPPTMNYPGAGFTNFGSSASGPLTAPQAVWRSSNTFFVKLEEQVGVLRVADMAERLGITSLPREGREAITPRDGALTLGTYELSPLELAGAYATFAAHGVHCDPIGITAITDARGEEVAVPPADCHQAISTGVADTMAAIMQGTIDGPDPARTGSEMSIGRPAAGKTGTTQGNAAVWFSGYTPQYATSVWVGDPRGGFRYPLVGFYTRAGYVARAYGGLVAGPIWRQVMEGLHTGLPVERFAPADPATSSGESRVTPDVRGMSVAQAAQVAAKSGHTVVIQRKRADSTLYGRNRVVGVSPAPGARIGFGEPIRLTLTDGSSITTEDLPEEYRGS